MSTELALSLTSLAQKDAHMLSLPISTLAKKAGLKAEDVYKRLLPALSEEKNLYEALKFAAVGLKYAAIVDQNRLREEVGVAFVATLEIIISLVQEGLDSDVRHIKRTAMLLHGDLIDEHAEKRRFIETITTENRLEELATAKVAQDKLRKELEESKF